MVRNVPGRILRRSNVPGRILRLSNVPGRILRLSNVPGRILRGKAMPSGAAPRQLRSETYRTTTASESPAAWDSSLYFRTVQAAGNLVRTSGSAVEWSQQLTGAVIVAAKTVPYGRPKDVLRRHVVHIHRNAQHGTQRQDIRPYEAE